MSSGYFAYYAICGQCSGSGEGMFDGSVCGHCGGEGEVPYEDDDEEEDDE